MGHTFCFSCLRCFGFVCCFFFSGFKILLFWKIQFLKATWTEHLSKDYSSVGRTQVWNRGDLDFSHSALLFSSCALLLHCCLFFSVLFLSCSRAVVLHLLFSGMRHTWQSPTVYSVESVFLCVLGINSTNAGEATLGQPVNLVYFCTLLRAGLEIIFSVPWVRPETSNTLQTVF